MFGFLKTAFNVVKGAVKGVVSIVKNAKIAKQVKREEALKQNTAQVTETAAAVNAAAPAVPFAQAFAPQPAQSYQAAPTPFNQVQTLDNVSLRSVLPAASPSPDPGNNKMMMIGGGIAALLVLVMVVMKKK